MTNRKLTAQVRRNLAWRVTQLLESGPDVRRASDVGRESDTCCPNCSGIADVMVGHWQVCGECGLHFRWRTNVA